jgi:hypothetical protein
VSASPTIRASSSTAAAAASSAPDSGSSAATGRDIEIEQVLDTEGGNGAMVCYREGEPTEMLRQTFWQLGFIKIGVYAPWKRPQVGA